MGKPIDLCIEKYDTQRELAALLDVSPQAITKWRRGRIPAERVLQIEGVTGISRHVLRPDLYPIEKSRRSASAAA